MPAWNSYMPVRDPRVDAYIAKSADFAKPILMHLRDTVHRACPEAEETVKWSMPTFMHHGILCGMAAFKQHCSLWFRQNVVITDPKLAGDATGMGQFGRLTKLADLPSQKVLMAYIKQAMAINESGFKKPRPKPKPASSLVVPDDLASALKKNKRARATFEAFSPSNKREYLEWITEAKREETRVKRLATAIEWMAEGKARNWKYMNC
jgi:uncharacterized protein YdeI (YjbR/CyaY-like superfamily)